MILNKERTFFVINEEIEVCTGNFSTYSLIPVYLEVLKDTPEYAQISMMPFPLPPAYAMEDNESEWWSSEECFFFIDMLVGTINAYTPREFYFGRHSKSPNRIGFWKEKEQ